MRIESIGLPGSGKSTLSAACSSALRTAGHMVVGPATLDQLDAANPPGNKGLWRRRNSRQSHHIGRYLSEHLNMHQFFNSHYARNMRNVGLSLSVGADLSRSQMHAERFDYFFVDEGFLHLGSHALLEHSGWDFAGCADGLEAFLDSLPRPDAVLYPEASAETATSGIFARMPEHSEAQAQRRFKNAFGGASGMRARLQLIDKIVKCLKDMAVPVIAVPAHSKLDDITDIAVTKLIKIQTANMTSL